MRRGRIRRPSHAHRIPLVVLLSATVGGLFGTFGSGTTATGALTGGLDGALLSSLEAFVMGEGGLPALTRLPFALYFGVRIAIYIVVILGVALTAMLRGGTFDRGEVEFALVVSVAFNLLFGVNELLGPGVLFAFVAGRYRRPRREARALLYLDLCGSTALAERLGEERFLDLLNAFFDDVTGEIEARDGEIHKYVGDEVIAVWRAETEAAELIAAAFAARRRLAERAEVYGREFGAAPTFRAAIHAGPVVIGELGARKKEIALIGDAMNTAARILEAARASGAFALVSSPYFDAMRETPPGVAASRLEPILLRGKAAPLALVAVEEEGA